MTDQERRKVVEDLPEVPVSVQNRLKPIGSSRLLAATPIVKDSRELPESDRVARKCNQAQCTETNFFTWVIFPVAICQPLESPTQEAFAMMVAGEDSLPPSNDSAFPLAGAYRLSTYRGHELRKPYFCTIRSGPWNASIVRTPYCPSSGPPTFQWRLSFLTVPGEPEFVLRWIGEWRDAPISPPLVVVGSYPEFDSQRIFCCEGYQLDDGACRDSESLGPDDFGAFVNPEAPRFIHDVDESSKTDAES